MSSKLTLCAVTAALLLGPATISPIAAEDTWNPFKTKELSEREKRRQAAEPAKPPALPPMGGVGADGWRQSPGGTSAPALDGGVAARPSFDQRPQSIAVERQALPAIDEKSRAVERGDLQPVLANDGSGLPLEFWQGVDVKVIEQALGQLDIPPRSAALGRLWRRIWTTNAEAPISSGGHFQALRLEALYRSGLLADARKLTDASGVADSNSPLLAAVRARVGVGLGERETGCKQARQVARAGGGIPKPLQAEVSLLTAFCSAAEGNLDAAGLTLDLVRGEADQGGIALAALDAIIAGQPFKPQVPKRLSLLDYRYLAAAKATPTAEMLAVGEPALLAALALDETVDPAVRIIAVEAAVRVNAVDVESLAQIYRAAKTAGGEQADPLTTRGDQNQRRAQLFRAFEAERTPMRKARLARALLDEARRARIGMQVAAAMSRAVDAISPAQEIGWFAETAIEISLSGGNLAGARRWLEFSTRDRGPDLQHWLLLIDIADAQAQSGRGAGFPAVEQMAVRGKLSNDLLHRLATVLDALDYQIPIPLWEAASRSPQPNSGHLPETGVLSDLQNAAKRRELAGTVLLAMRAIGPTSADGAHIIALGDTIRALRRAGLEPDARSLALEAVIGGWPRMGTN